MSTTDESIEPDVIVRGPGEPELAVVGGIHGDEPSGIRTIERLLGAGLDLQRGVKFVIANPPAVAAGERYLDTDLNRTFPGDPDGNREERLAAHLCAELAALPTLSLHATHAQPEPFALVDRSKSRAIEIASRLPVEHVVDHADTTDGTLTACGPVVTIEAGCQHTDEATDAAERQARAFLRVMGALAGEAPAAYPEYFTMRDPVRKPADCESTELHVENFEPVEKGTTYASMDGRELVAEEPFYPILMSECGYEDIFGYRGWKVGSSPEDAHVGFTAISGD